MLKITSAEAGDKNSEQGGKEIQVEDRGEKGLAQKSRTDQKTAKSKKWIQAEKAEASRAENLSIQSGSFPTFGARKAFTELRQAFVEAPILNHFDPERHIQTETDASGYAIGGIFSQLTLDDSGRWYLVAFFSKKMISIET